MNMTREDLIMTSKYTYTYNATSKYTYNVNLTCCAVDTKAMYGYWDRRDGAEGGGLWFTRDARTGVLKLSDFDGAFELPAAISTELRAAGFVVDSDLYG